jgi:hypothetical protein
MSGEVCDGRKPKAFKFTELESTGLTRKRMGARRGLGRSRGATHRKSQDASVATFLPGGLPSRV